MTSPLSRRTAAAALVAFPRVWTGSRAQPTPARIATPSQTEGPFYPVEFPKGSDFDLLRNGNLVYGGGQSTWVEGRLTTGADGAYRFRTLKPVVYGSRTPHIHTKVKLGTRELLTLRARAG